MLHVQVDWREPWLLVLLTFHLLTTVAIFLLRHHTYPQATILVTLGEEGGGAIVGTKVGE